MNLIISRQRDALAAGADKYFTGKPCKQGHIAYRYMNGNCSDCTKLINNPKWKKANPYKSRDASEAWRKKHQFYVTAKHKANRDANLETQRKKELDRYRRRKHKKGLLPIPTRITPMHCENCGELPDAGKALAIDHCHKTGRFRGWLCFSCNTGIGRLGDNVKSLMRAINYLERSKTP